MRRNNKRNSQQTLTEDPKMAENALAAIKTVAAEIKGAEKVAVVDKPTHADADIDIDADQGTLDLLGEVAGRFAARTYPPAYFVVKDAEFKTKESILTDDEGIVLLDKSRMGWLRWSTGNRVVERANWVPILKHREPLRPDSFNDETRWDTWSNGGKKDPWQFTLEAPVLLKSGPLAGRVVMFASNSRSSEAAVGDLLLIARDAKQGWRPRIKFAVIEGQPVLQVVEFTDDASDIPGLAPAAGNVGPKPAPRANGSDNRQAAGGRVIDDEIPF